MPTAWTKKWALTNTCVESLIQVFSKQIWCSADRAKTWNDWMLEGRAPGAKDDCDTSAVTKNQEFGRRLNISGTPTIFFADGERVPGAIPLPKLEQKLSQLK